MSTRRSSGSASLCCTLRRCASTRGSSRAKQAELTEHFSDGEGVRGSDRRVYMLYECFTTWSDEVIPKRGAFLTPGSISAEGHEHFISIVTAPTPRRSDVVAASPVRTSAARPP